MTKADFSETSICTFAESVGIAPGIVVGRLQNEGCIKYSMLNKLKEHYEIKWLVIIYVKKGVRIWHLFKLNETGGVAIPHLF